MMKTFLTILFYISLALFIKPLSIFAQERSFYDLDKLYNIAAKENRNIKIAKKTVESAEGNVIGAVSEFMPELKYSIAKGQTIRSDKNNAPVGNLTALQPKKSQIVRVSVGGPLFAGGRLWQNVMKEKVLAKRAVIGIKSTQQGIYREITDSFYQLSYTQAVLAIEKKKLVFFKKYYEEAKIKEKEGEIRKTMLLGAQVDYHSASNDVVKAELELENARLDLRYLLAEDVDETLSVSPLIQEVTANNLAEFAQLEEAVMNNPDLQGAKEESEAASLDVAMAHSYYYPEVSYALAYQQDKDLSNHASRESLSIGLEVKVPFFDSLLNGYGKSRSAVAEKYKSDMMLEDVSTKTALVLKQRRNQLKSAYRDMLSAQEMENFMGLRERNDKIFLQEGEIGFEIYKKTYLEHLDVQKKMLHTIARVNSVYKILKIDFGQAQLPH